MSVNYNIGSGAVCQCVDAPYCMLGNAATAQLGTPASKQSAIGLEIGMIPPAVSLRSLFILVQTSTLQDHKHVRAVRLYISGTYTDNERYSSYAGDMRSIHVCTSVSSTHKELFSNDPSQGA